MGFVDGDAGELALRIDGLEVSAEGLCEGVLRGNVEEAGAWVTFRIYLSFAIIG